MLYGGTHLEDQRLLSVGNQSFLAYYTSNFSDSLAQPFSRPQLSKFLSELSQIVSIGTHHDTIPSTSKDFVHDSEMKKFQ